MLYYVEVADIVSRLNSFVPGEEKLFMPDEKFHRAIGRYADMPYDVKGNLLTEEEFPAYIKSVLPSEQDYKQLGDIFKDPTWIAERALPKDLWGYQENIRKATVGR
jgi:hypothetical protein